MSMPPQQPGSGAPEGGWPPGQPGAGGQPHPAPGPYGYPQQGVPYGQPAGQQPPYGQPGYGAQPGPGYGAPYPGGPGAGGPGQQPPGGSGKKVAVVVAAVLAGALAIGGVVFAVSDRGGDDGKRDEAKVDTSTDPTPKPSTSEDAPTPKPSPSSGRDLDADDPSTTYRVVLPKTLENGAYTMAKDLSSPADDQVPDSGSGASGVKPKIGRYANASRERELVVNGLNGTFASPAYAKDSFLSGMESNDDAEVGVPRREITPPGSKRTLSCEVVIKEQNGQEMVMPMCIWADTSTLVAVVENDMDNWGAEPTSIDLDGFAARVVKMHGELLVPNAS